MLQWWRMPRFRVNGLMGVGRLTKENTPNENPKLVPWEMSTTARNNGCAATV